MRLLLLVAVAAAHALPNNSSCGPRGGPKVPDCEFSDLGSCGNACCVVEMPIGPFRPADVYHALRSYLQSGGTDGSFTYVNKSDAAGHNPGDNLTHYHIPAGWQYILQGTHKTTGGYFDTLDFAVRTTDGGKTTTVRGFSISNIHGALGDGGQNFKTMAYISRNLMEPHLLPIEPVIIYGCGKGQ